MSKDKGKEKKTENQEGPQNVAEVFALARDVEMENPYHMDGDIDMYSEEQLEIREKMRNDPAILKTLTDVKQ